MEEIKESGYNEFYRIVVTLSMKVTLVIGIVLSVSFIPLIIKERSLILILFYILLIIPITIISYILKNRFVRIKSINSNKIIIAYGKNDTVMMFEDIYAVTVLDIYPIKGRNRILLTFYSRIKGKKDWVIFMNEPNYRFVEKFRNIGIKCKTFF